MAKEDITFESVSDLLVEELPELRARYREVLAWWGDERPPQHILYEDILNPYISELIQEKNEAGLRRTFELVERMARSSDRRVQEIVAVTICDYIVADPRLLAQSRPFMGAFTQKQCDEMKNARLL